MVDAIAGIAALRPLETASSGSAVCWDKAETIAGDARSRKLSIKVAIEPSLLNGLTFDES